MMKYLNYILFICLSLIFVQCNDNQSSAGEDANMASADTQEFKLPEWAKAASIYELNIRNFSQEGDLKSVKQELPRIKDMGIDIIWFMPVHPIGIAKRKATPELNVSDIENPEDRAQYLGSPYSVKDYRAVHPDYGTLDEFKALVSYAHSIGLKIIIDWVPNHTAWDHDWITQHPEYYTQDENGNIIDPIDYNTGEPWGWTDVADLNYDNREMRKAMIEEMKFWLSDVDIDGFRVDVAHGIPQDFWDEVTPALMSVKQDIFMLAESEVPSHRNNETYHATYGWSFHHLLNEIAKGEKQAKDIADWLETDRDTFKTGFSMHFTSNHDENTWAGTVFDRMGDGHKAFAVLVSTFDGMPLVYNGQEAPLRKRLEFFRQDPIEWGDMAYQDFYKQLLTLKDSNPALWNGEYGAEPQIIYADDQIIAYSRIKSDNEVLAVINLSDSEAAASLEIDDNDYKELNNKEIMRNAEAQVILGPWDYYVFYR